MANDFSRILTLLRKERSLSQKQAAQDLNISQALLSHYERGIRECGLDFLLRAADYYEVSCDYLLGRTPDRNGARLPLALDKTPEKDDDLPQTLLRGAQEVLFSLLQEADHEMLTEAVSEFLYLSVYRMFRVLYGANPKNPNTFFQLPKPVAPAFAQARMNEDEAIASAIASGYPLKKMLPLKDTSALSMTTRSLTERYPNAGSALLALVKQCEERLKEEAPAVY